MAYRSGPADTVASTSSSQHRRPTHRISPSLSSLSFGSTGNPSGSTASASATSPRPLSMNFSGLSPASPFMDRSASSASSSSFGNDYEETQNRTFCKWLNTRLEPLGLEPLSNLKTDFADGTRLIQLVEVLTGESLGRYNRQPVMRVQMAENVIKALDRIKEMGVHLTNIGPEDIMEPGNRKLILGMVWLLMLRFLIADIDEEGSHAKEGLLLWCQRRTAAYAPLVDVKNFAKSWGDGLAFCALIHRHRPDLLDYESLDKSGSPDAVHRNTELAFAIAETDLGIPRLLDVSDVVDARRPDEKSVMTYVAQFFHAFSSKAREETEARIITNFVEHMKSLLLGIHDYERRVTEFMASISHLLSTWRASPPSSTSYSALKDAQAAFLAHKLVQKREWVRERAEISALLGHVQTKLRTYGMRAYEPAEGLRPADLDERWQKLLEAEADRSRAINAMIRQIKENLRTEFAELANGFEAQLQAVRSGLADIEGSLETQRSLVSTFQTRISSLASSLAPIHEKEQECQTCNVDENDYTVYSFDDLDFEFGQLKGDVDARQAFISNQIVARNVTNVTPEQLEEFESVFRAFDKDSSNTLDLDELVGALGALGMSERDVDLILHEADNSGSELSFEAFIQALVDKTEDRITPAKLRNTFLAVAAEKSYITELDLTRLHLPESTTQFFKDYMKELNDVSDEGAAYDFEGFLDALLDS